jgi:membrane protein
MKDYITGIINEIYSHSYRTISVAAIFALWSASRGFFALLKGLRTVYKSRGRKVTSIMRTEGIIYTLLFILGLVSFFVLVIFGKQLYRTYIKPFVELGHVISFILRIRGLFLILIMTIVFSLIYKFFVPRKKLHFRDQIYGAAFAAVAWFVLSWIFSIYINIFHGFANLYGSLTTVMLIMMWVYACLYAILLGAEINVFIMKHVRNSEKEIK